MKRILFITHTASMGGGAEKVLMTLVNELSKDYRIDVIERLEDNVLPFVPNNKNICHLPSMSKSDRLAAATGSCVLLQRLWRLLLSLLIFLVPRHVYRHYIREKYDFEISFNYLYPSYLVAYSPNLESKKIMWIHGDIFELSEPYACGVRGLKAIAMKTMQRRAFSMADTIVAISRRTYDSILKFMPEVRDKTCIIYNGYDIQKIRTMALSPGFEKNRFTLVSIGRLEKPKNFELQILALLQIVSQGIDIELHILGDGPYINELKQEAGVLLNKNIFFEGFQANPYPFIRSSDALIITSKSEGFPTVAVEAMALGKPVISTPVAGTDELINSNTGIVVDWSVEGVVKGIMQIMNRPLDPFYIQNFTSKYSKESWAKNVEHYLR